MCPTVVLVPQHPSLSTSASNFRPFLPAPSLLHRHPRPFVLGDPATSRFCLDALHVEDSFKETWEQTVEAFATIRRLTAYDSSIIQRIVMEAVESYAAAGVPTRHRRSRRATCVCVFSRYSNCAQPLRFYLIPCPPSAACRVRLLRDANRSQGTAGQALLPRTPRERCKASPGKARHHGVNLFSPLTTLPFFPCPPSFPLRVPIFSPPPSRNALAPSPNSSVGML